MFWTHIMVAIEGTVAQVLQRQANATQSYAAFQLSGKHLIYAP